MGFYLPSVAGTELQQGELISGVKQFVPLLPRESVFSDLFTPIEYDVVVVLSQSCDLVARSVEQNDLGVLLGQVWPESVAAGSVKELPRIRQNVHHKYEYLRKFEAQDDAEGIGSAEHLIVDFRRVFTLPLSELLFQITCGARRRCVLDVPYREHLASRYAYFVARVALPEDHEVRKLKALPGSFESPA